MLPDMKVKHTNSPFPSCGSGQARRDGVGKKQKHLRQPVTRAPLQRCLLPEHNMRQYIKLNGLFRRQNPGLLCPSRVYLSRK